MTFSDPRHSVKKEMSVTLETIRAYYTPERIAAEVRKRYTKDGTKDLEDRFLQYARIQLDKYSEGTVLTCIADSAAYVLNFHDIRIGSVTFATKVTLRTMTSTFDLDVTMSPAKWDVDHQESLIESVRANFTPESMSERIREHYMDQGTNALTCRMALKVSMPRTGSLWEDIGLTSEGLTRIAAHALKRGDIKWDTLAFKIDIAETPDVIKVTCIVEPLVIPEGTVLIDAEPVYPTWYREGWRTWKLTANTTLAIDGAKATIAGYLHDYETYLPKAVKETKHVFVTYRTHVLEGGAEVMVTADAMITHLLLG